MALPAFAAPSHVSYDGALVVTLTFDGWLAAHDWLDRFPRDGIGLFSARVIGDRAVRLTFEHRTLAANWFGHDGGSDPQLMAARPAQAKRVLAERPREPQLKIIGPHIGGWLVVDDSEFRQAQFEYATAWIAKSAGKPEPLPDLSWAEQLADGTVLVCSTRGAVVWAEDDPSAVNPRRLFMTSEGRFALFRSYAPPGRNRRLLYDGPPVQGMRQPLR